MGVAQITGARIFKGNARDGALALDSIENVAFVRTYSSNFMVTDSAAAGTAMATGVKTNQFRIGMGPDQEILETILEKAKKAGKSVGVVTTTTVTHGTPASFYAHVPARWAEDEIARQLIENNAVDLVLGGGRGFFYPKGHLDPETGEASSRKDERNLVAEAEAAGATVLQKTEEFLALLETLEAGDPPDKVLGLFSHGHMAYDLLRGDDPWGEPSLAEMTDLAIRFLSRNPKGYFLLIEGGRIDHAGHDNKAHLVFTETIAFDDAVARGLEETERDANLLIVVTSDHETGGMAINGYPPLDVSGASLIAPTFSKKAADIVTFATGPGFDRSKVHADRSSAEYRQPALLDTGNASHTGVDVPLYAAGAGAEAFGGTIENTEVAKRMMALMGLK